MNPIVPDEQYRPAVPALRSAVGQRSPTSYLDVANQFDVEHTKRYQPDSLHTYCNIALWDITSAMSAEVPHWVDLITGAPCPMGHGAELSANATVDWLAKYGATYGWTPCTVDEARANASAGCPTIAVWKNPLPGHSGHVVSIMPDDTANFPNSPMITQAGAHNYFYVPLAKGFGTEIQPTFYKHA